MKKRVKVLVVGKVQGVSFRSSLGNLARENNVFGYAKNRSDNQLEAVFEGNEDDVKVLVTFCHHGPDGADIEAIFVDEEEFKDEFKEFEVIKE